MSAGETAGEEPDQSWQGELEPPEGPPSWLTVARKDIGAGARSWQLYVLTGVFTAAMALVSLDPVFRQPDHAGEIAAQVGIGGIAGVVGAFFPLVILMLVQMSIVGERRRGSLRVMLALPVTRGEMLFGTLVGRTVVVGGTAFAALAINGLAMLLLYDSMDVGAYAGFSVVVVAFCTLFVAMAVGISAAASTRGRAIAMAIAAYVLSNAWIMPIVEMVTGVYPVTNVVSQDVAPGWWVFLARLRPSKGWRLVVTDWIVPVLPESGRGDTTYYAQYTTPGAEPFYLDTWALVLALTAWGVVPLLVGYWRFRQADIR